MRKSVLVAGVFCFFGTGAAYADCSGFVDATAQLQKSALQLKSVVHSPENRVLECKLGRKQVADVNAWLAIIRSDPERCGVSTEKESQVVGLKGGYLDYMNRHCTDVQ